MTKRHLYKYRYNPGRKRWELFDDMFDEWRPSAFINKQRIRNAIAAKIISVRFVRWIDTWAESFRNW
jgi:hypothetical protein